MKKFFLATFAYAVATMTIAAPWHFVIFKDLYESLGIYTRAEPIVPLGFLSMIIQGAVMAYLYPLFYRRGHWAKQGIKFSLLMGLFLFSVSTLANAAKMNVTSIPIWIGIQVAFHLIQFLVAGIFVGFVFRDARKS